MSESTEIQSLIKTLNNAWICCHECGTKWGVYSVKSSSVFFGTCSICNKDKPVVDTRDYAYFITGIHKLKQQLKELS